MTDVDRYTLEEVTSLYQDIIAKKVKVYRNKRGYGEPALEECPPNNYPLPGSRKVLWKIADANECPCCGHSKKKRETPHWVDRTYRTKAQKAVIKSALKDAPKTEWILTLDYPAQVLEYLPTISYGEAAIIKDMNGFNVESVRTCLLHTKDYHLVKRKDNHYIICTSVVD